MKELFKVDENAMSGLAMVKRILQLEVDLLWNGGIGTYVKASKERNEDVGDASNDGVRIDAAELKAKVVGEGGNLGLTQLARIEYSLLGGRLNTDAIDNSGGVDMSDHEVNIKILLQPQVTRGALSFEQRNLLLEEMTDEVSRLVLKNNYTQSLCLSIAASHGAENLRFCESLQRALESTGRLKPQVEFLPDSEVLESRLRTQQGYTRPELAILLAYDKMNLKQRLLGTRLLEESELRHYLYDYFPEVLSQRFGELIGEHPLSREIVATQLTNLIIDCLGLGFVHRLVAETGEDQRKVIRAIVGVMEILDLDSSLSRVFALDATVKVEEQYRAVKGFSEAIRSMVQWLILSGSDLEDLSGFIQNYKQPLKEITGDLHEVLYGSSEKRRFQRGVDSAVAEGFPEDLAREIAIHDYLTSCLGVVDVAHSAGVSPKDAARSFYAIGNLFQLGWLRDALETVATDSSWNAIALGGLIVDLRHVQRQLTIEYYRRQPVSLRDFLKELQETAGSCIQMLRNLKKSGVVSLAAGSVITRLLLQHLDQYEGRGPQVVTSLDSEKRD
jgi:glutamate dehydrogenase